jgi:hypothetical protein
MPLLLNNKFQSAFGHYVFFAFAALQIIPWICDIIENIYLLEKMKQGSKIHDSKAILYTTILLFII